MSGYIVGSSGATASSVVGSISPTRDNRLLQITGANGDTLTLTDRPGGYSVKWGVRGLGMPPVDVQLEEGAGPGARFRQVRPLRRVIDMVVKVEGSTWQERRDRQNRLANLLDNTYGPSLIEVLQPDGTAQQSECYYGGGAEGEGGAGRDTSLQVRWPITLICPEPYWRDRDPVIRSWRASGPVAAFPLRPGLFRLSDSQIIGANVVIINPGDVEAYPLWTVRGPGGPVTIRNSTTAKEFTLNVDLAVNEWVQVDTDRKTATDNGNLNVWPLFDPNPQLWTLRPGENAVELLVTGATSASLVELSFRPRRKTV